MLWEQEQELAHRGLDQQNGTALGWFRGEKVMSVDGEFIINRIRQISQSIEEHLNWTRNEVLLRFGQLEREADEIRQSALMELQARAWTDAIDMNSPAAVELAEAAGIYLFADTMPAARSSIMCLLTSKLFERLQEGLVNLCQHQTFVTDAPNDTKLETLAAWYEKHLGVTFYRFLAWSKIEQMQWLCNIVKEKDNESALRLRAVRPEFFHQPASEQLNPDWPYWVSPVDPGAPGEGLHLTRESFEDYGAATIEFLREMSQHFRADERFPR